MDQNYVAMGYIIEGMSILNDVENIATFNERPKRPLLIHDCGLLKNALWYLKNMSSLPILSFRFVPNFSRRFIHMYYFVEDPIPFRAQDSSQITKIDTIIITDTWPVYILYKL